MILAPGGSELSASGLPALVSIEGLLMSSLGPLCSPREQTSAQHCLLKEVWDGLGSVKRLTGYMLLPRYQGTNASLPVLLDLQVSTRLGDAPEWETSQFGSRLDPASFNITTSYLIMTELN